MKVYENDDDVSIVLDRSQKNANFFYANGISGVIKAAIQDGLKSVSVWVGENKKTGEPEVSLRFSKPMKREDKPQSGGG